MQVYEPRALNELETSTKEVVEAIKYETRMMTLSSAMYVYQLLSCVVSIVLACLFDNFAMRFVVPCSIVSVLVVSDSIVNMLRFRAWQKRSEAETRYFQKAKAVFDQNMRMTMDYIANMTLAEAAASAPETRVIN